MPIHLNNVSKYIDGKMIFKNFSMTVEDEEIVWLKGPSGSGKTTILNLIMGFYKPDKGTVSGTQGKRIACVFQDKRLLMNETAQTNVSCVIKGHKRKEQALKWLDLVGLQENYHKKVKDLSGGMQQLVAIARALAFEKDILLLDEPFTGLDEQLKAKVSQLIMEHAKKISTVLVTHEESTLLPV